MLGVLDLQLLPIFLAHYLSGTSRRRKFATALLLVYKKHVRKVKIHYV